LPLDPLVEQAADQRKALDDAASDNPPVQALVERYEQIYDSQGEVASGEEIAAEIERFLRQADGGDASVDG
jgi:hypothetical protein